MQQDRLLIQVKEVQASLQYAIDVWDREETTFDLIIGKAQQPRSFTAAFPQLRSAHISLRAKHGRGTIINHIIRFFEQTRTPRTHYHQLR